LVLGPVSVESPNCGGGEIGKDSVELEDSLAVELEEENWDVEKDVENWDVEKDVETKLTSLDAYARKCRAAGAGPPTPSPSIMTADTGLETQRSAGVDVIGPPAARQFDFGNSFGDSFGGLTDEDRVTTMASKETLAWPSRGDKQEMGSYGVHGDAQRKSLRLVEESKDFGSGCFKGEEGQGTCWVAQARVPSVQESPAEGLFGLPRKRLWVGLGEKATSKKGRREDRAGS